MHRHGYKGTKFGRERGARRALLKSLSESLILNESIETTLPKAKAVVSYTERLITKAKAGGLANRRRVISSLSTLEAAHKLVNEISPKLTTRDSGYFRIVKTSVRRGDNSQLAKVSFVDELAKLKAPKSEAKTEKLAAKKATEKPKTTSAKPRANNRSAGTTKQVNQAAKRTGNRGNR